MEAEDPTEYYNEAKRLEKALRDNPKDIDAQLKTASMLDDPELKRKLLNCTLSLDPTNKTAREMLLEMDRAEMHAGFSQQSPQTTSASIPSEKKQSEKLLVSRYSLID